MTFSISQSLKMKTGVTADGKHTPPPLPIDVCTRIVEGPFLKVSVVLRVDRGVHGGAPQKVNWQRKTREAGCTDGRTDRVGAPPEEDRAVLTISRACCSLSPRPGSKRKCGSFVQNQERTSRKLAKALAKQSIEETQQNKLPNLGVFFLQ